MKKTFLLAALCFTMQPQVYAEDLHLPRSEAAQMLYDGLSEEKKESIFCEYNSFSDTDLTADYNIAVSSLANVGVFTGYRCGMFAPEREMTRAEFLATVMRLYDVPLEDAADVYWDVNESDWYYGYVCAANGLGLMYGVNSYWFKPNEPITKSDAKNLVYKVKGGYNVR